MTNKDVIKEIRLAAKNVGLTFKIDARRILNGSVLYEFVERGTGRPVTNLMMLESAFNDVCSGYIASWNGEEFVGINHYVVEDNT